MIVKKAYF